ncbi:MAG: hypothetical protein KCCBMMGE_02269 [Candidatus Methanoperedenaceae archaeon GB37]|nr:MAG: hypothetical protein KCCBMMGE_02269 [Candidatus Methanoperedenaceae archaeon GB37]
MDIIQLLDKKIAFYKKLYALNMELKSKFLDNAIEVIDIIEKMEKYIEKIENINKKLNYYKKSLKSDENIKSRIKKIEELIYKNYKLNQSCKEMALNKKEQIKKKLTILQSNSHSNKDVSLKPIGLRQSQAISNLTKIKNPNGLI